jgi:hypothetical protein
MRRDALLILYISFFIFVGFGQAPRVMTVLPVDSAITDVRMFPPGDPSFQEFINKKIPTDELPVFQPILPYSVVLQNASAKPILGFCVRFDIVDSDGHQTFMSQWGGFSAGDVALPPGVQAWISAESGYNASAVHSKIRFGLVHQPGFYGSARSVAVSLDSVLLADGTLSGPDKQGMFNVFASRLRADKLLTQAVLGLKANSGGLQQFLTTQIASDARGDDGTKETRRRVGELQRVMRKEGADAAVAKASSLLSAASSINLHRIGQ